MGGHPAAVQSKHSVRKGESMTKRAAKPIPSMDTAVTKAIEELRAYAETRPEAEAIKSQYEALRRHPDQEGTCKLCRDLGWNYLQIGQYSKAMKFTELAIRLKKPPDIISSFNKGLILLAQGKAAKAYEVYHQAVGRACRSDNYRTILEAILVLRGFVARKGIQVDQGSPLLELLGGEFDLLRLLASSKTWGQDLKPEIYDRICIQGQKVSEEDLRNLRSTPKKKAKKVSPS